MRHLVCMAWQVFGWNKTSIVTRLEFNDDEQLTTWVEAWYVTFGRSGWTTEVSYLWVAFSRILLVAPRTRLLKRGFQCMDWVTFGKRCSHKACVISAFVRHGALRKDFTYVSMVRYDPLSGSVRCNLVEDDLSAYWFLWAASTPKVTNGVQWLVISDRSVHFAGGCSGGCCAASFGAVQQTRGNRRDQTKWRCVTSTSYWSVRRKGFCSCQVGPWVLSLPWRLPCLGYSVLWWPHYIAVAHYNVLKFQYSNVAHTVPDRI